MLGIRLAIYSTTSPAARKGRNLWERPECSLAARAPAIDIVIEGTASWVDDRGLLEQIAAAYNSKYGWPVTVTPEKVNWSSEWKKKSRNRVLSAPKTAHYIAGWPRDTDLGVIAEVDGERIGAAWLRFLPAADPGYGFVAPDVPELTIGVAVHWRGRGAGRALLRAIADQACSAGTRRISLSVERKNVAWKLYISEGYQIVDSSDKDSDTMVKDLAASRVQS